MFTLSTIKNNGKTKVNLHGGYILPTYDIAFKDICISLINEKRNIEKFIHKYNGYLEIKITNYTHELTQDENTLIELDILPRNNVIIKSDGYCFEDILYILKAVQQQIILEFNPNFEFNVDFITLKIE